MKTHLQSAPTRLKLSSLILLFTAFIATESYAGENKNEWTLSKSVDNVDFYYKIAKCNNESFVLLKFENKNDKAVTISWQSAFETAEIPEKRVSTRPKKSMTLTPGVTSQETCESITRKECIIIPDEIAASYYPTVTDYSFESVSVK